MMKILVAMLCLTSIAQGKTVCTNSNTDTEKETSIIMENGMLLSVCSRDVSPAAEANRKSTLEICSADQFLISAGGNQSVNGVGAKKIQFTSTASEKSFGVLVEMALDSSSAEVTIQQNYVRPNLARNGQTEVAAGSYSMLCHEAVAKK